MQYKGKTLVTPPKNTKYIPVIVKTATEKKTMGISDIELVGDTKYAKIGKDTYLWDYIEKKPIVLTTDHYKMSDIYPDIYATMTEVPDELDISKLPTTYTDNWGASYEVYDYSEMFAGCSSLKTIPELETKAPAAKNFSRMFAGCSSLPKVFPYALWAWEEPKIDGMFEGSSVEEVSFIGLYDSHDPEYYLSLATSRMNLTFDNMDSTGTLKKITLLKDDLTPWKTLTRT